MYQINNDKPLTLYTFAQLQKVWLLKMFVEDLAKW
jgi:hypothetical protein